MSNDQAAALLNYHMDSRVEAAMRQRLQDDPEDGNAWHYLSLALRAEGRFDEADASDAKAAEFGTGERSWHADLRLGSFVDSNVVVAPDAIGLGARDRGDIGARVNVFLAGQAFDTGSMRTAWSLAYADMKYQDFNAFAIRQMQAGLAQHLDVSESVNLWLGAHVDQASLGGASLLKGWDGLGGVGAQLNDNHALNIDFAYGHRNFLSGYNAFTAWRWKATPLYIWQGDGLKATIAAHIAREQTHSAAEAYRETGIATSGGWRMLDRIAQGDIWLEGSAAYHLRNYARLNSQSFLIRPIKRRDAQFKLLGALAWKRDCSLLSDKIAETWKFQAGWIRNRSNINRSAVFDTAQSRDWKRWTTEASIQWHY